MNYNHAVSLLQEHFRQSHKIISAHMQALLDISKPVNLLSSMKLFQDSVEGHIRGLAALGKSEDSYGALVVPIIYQLKQEVSSLIPCQSRMDAKWT